MVITIVVADKAVYKDGFCYSDLALLNIPNDVRALQFNSTNNLGHIEFAYSYGDTPIPNQEISELPAWANDCLAAWDAADYAHKNPPPPTPEQLIADCKTQAKQYLQDTDWSEIPSVSDQTKNPHLINTAEFVIYRNVIRNYAVNPVATPSWPVQPVAQWS